MYRDLNKPVDSSVAGLEANAHRAEVAEYTAPALYVMGRSRDLLQGSGRHKNDDTHRPGFEVDQR
jgi:hypothetical protein